MLRSFLDPGQTLLDDRFPLPLDEPFSYLAARAAGLQNRDLQLLSDKGFVRRLVVGVYVATQVPDSLGLRAAALQLVVPAEAVVTDRTAGWLHGSDMVLAPGDHLRVPPVSMHVNRRGGRLRNSLSASGQRFLQDDEILVVHGVRVTSAIRTACDLGRLRNRDAAFAALVAMFRLGMFTRPDLVEFIGRFRGMRYVRRLRSFPPMLDRRAESFGEAVLLLRWWDTMHVAPDLQIEVPRPGQWPYAIDLGIEALLVGFEYYGEEWHLRTSEQRERDEKRVSWLEDERGWLIEPVTKANLWGPKRDIEQLIVERVDDARRRLGLR